MQKQIIKASSRARRFYLIFLVSLTTVAVVALQWGLPAFSTYLFSLDPLRAVWIANTLIIIIFSPCIAFGIYWLWLSRKIQRSQQFPPPDVAVLRDTTVVFGAAVQRYVWSALLVGLLFTIVGIIGAFGIPYYIWRNAFAI